MFYQDEIGGGPGDNTNFGVDEDAQEDAEEDDIQIDTGEEVTHIPDECGNGVDDNENGRIDEACTCFTGQTQACWPGALSQRGVGACRDGVQQCEGVGEFLSWGECEGYVLPSPEVLENNIDDDCDGLIDCDDPDVDHLPQCLCVPEVCSDRVDNDCDGLVDCDDPDCSSNPDCFCNTGGGWNINDLWYACPSDGFCSNPALESGCHDTWSTGGSFNARCAGDYEICARVVSNISDCTVVEKCISVTIHSDGASVGLPPLSGWHSTNSCANEAAWGGNDGGGRTCVHVTGTTFEGIHVTRDAGCFAAFCACNATDCGGGSGGTNGTGTW